MKGEDEPAVKAKGGKYWMSVIGHVMILCCGMAVIVLQFVKLST